MTNAPYSEDYKLKCYYAWYNAGRPTSIARTIEIIPADEFGRKPNDTTLNEWMKENMWTAQADVLDAKAIELANQDAIIKKANMLKRQAEESRKLAEKARSQMMREDFDSSASASQTYFRAHEEERLVSGIIDRMEVSKMGNDLLKEIILERIRRAGENDQILDIEAIDVSQNDTESDEKENES